MCKATANFSIERLPAFRLPRHAPAIAAVQEGAPGCHIILPVAPLRPKTVVIYVWLAASYESDLEMILQTRRKSDFSVGFPACLRDHWVSFGSRVLVSAICANTNKRRL